MQADPLQGKKVATVLVLVDVEAGDLEVDQALGEEDQHRGDRRGGASGDGSPHSNEKNPPVLFPFWPLPQTWKPRVKDSWSSDTFESLYTEGHLMVTGPDWTSGG